MILPWIGYHRRMNGTPLPHPGHTEDPSPDASEPRPWEARRYRDPHGRGPRQPQFGKHLPHYRTRAGLFDSVVAAQLKRLAAGWPDLIASTEFLVEDVPAANLVPWEEPAVQFSVSYAAGHDEPARIILYRLPIQSATRNRIELEYIVHDEIVRQLAGLSGKSPEDIDPDPLF